MFSKTQDDRAAADAPGNAPRPGRAATGQRSILASDLRIDGIVATEGALEVHGRIEGEVAADAILLGEDGSITGKVRANQADLRGTLTGELTTDRLTLRAAARMEADATCETLVIEAGATVEGRFSRPAPPPPASPAPAPTTPPAAPAAPAS
ncbi:MAG: polymer-forming cytoskeletal protein [Gemmobacter sp.]